jgi:hypothetical protein
MTVRATPRLRIALLDWFLDNNKPLAISSKNVRTAREVGSGVSWCSRDSYERPLGLRRPCATLLD